MNNREIIILDTADQLYVRAAEEIVHISGEAICTHGQFNFCLTGGSTPAKTYELIATRFEMSVDWKAVHFFWGDERCVPPTDSASNFAMANRTMLSKLKLDAGQVHRIKGELEPEAGAEDYANVLKEILALEDREWPRFDLLLLGLGDNAHIASLFPDDIAISERERIAVAVDVDAPQRRRVTLTTPVLNNAARTMFLVSGESKAQAVKDVLEGPHAPARFPGQLIAPGNGSVMWLLDKPAASLLTQTR